MEWSRAGRPPERDMPVLFHGITCPPDTPISYGDRANQTGRAGDYQVQGR